MSLFPEMAPFYLTIAEELKVPVDQELLKSMEQANAEALQKLEEKIADAEQNLGETEVNDGLLAKAEHFADIGDKVSFANLAGIAYIII